MEPGRPRRILVPLDASPASLSDAEHAAEFASALGAELVGLFVEEVELLELCEHPLARALDPLTGLLAPLERAALQRRLRAQAARVRRTLEGVARRRSLACSFRVETGNAVTCIRAAAEEVDLVSVGRYGWSGDGRRRMGSTARALLNAGAPAILIQGRLAASGPVLVSYGGFASGRRTVEAAAQLAERLKRRLVVLIAAADEAAAQELGAELARELGENPAMSFEWAPSEDAEALTRRLSALAPAMAVLGAESPLVEGRLPELVEALDCPVMIVAAGTPAARA